jgi:hypothetical protein
MNNVEIDQLVAEKVMGWVKLEILGGHHVWEDIEDNWHGAVEDFNPSEDLNFAWMIVDKLLEEGIHLYIHPTRTYTNIHRSDYSGEYAHGETTAKALCLAGLRARNCYLKGIDYI